MMIYLVIELYRNGEAPRIIGAFKSRKRANEIAYDPRELHWRNVVPLRVLN